MTQENYNYRTSPLFLRNQFEGMVNFKIPIIPKAEFTVKDFEDLLLIGFDRTNLENNNHTDRMVHFFCMTINLNVFGKARIMISKS